MDNAGKWHPTIAEAEALRKFDVADKRHKEEMQRWKTAVIAGSLFLATLFVMAIAELAKQGWQ